MSDTMRNEFENNTRNGSAFLVRISGRFLNPHPVRISVYKCIIIKVLFLLVILYFKDYTTNKMESEMRTVHFHPYNIIIFNTIFICYLYF